MLNIYEQVDQNKRRSALIILAFILFITGFVWLVGKAFGSQPEIIIWAVVFSLFSSIASYFWGDKIILTLSGAKPAEREKYFNFYTAAENLAIAAQIPKPELYVIESPALNAFATGRDPNHALVCATTGLIEKLDKSELEAVVAHEISHIANCDIRLMMIVALLVGMVAILSDFILRAGRSSDRERKGNPIVLLFGLVALIISPLIAKLIQLAISRRREYLADASAVKLTKQPQGLINALEKLGQSPIILKTASPATAHLYIANPLKKMAGLFSTHPPIEERIASLKKML